MTFIAFPLMVFKTYRNIAGPFENLNLVFEFLIFDLFGNITICLAIIEGKIVWYVNEKILKNKVEFDLDGMAQCIVFFTLVWSFGLTYLLGNIEKNIYENIKNFMGAPLDFSDLKHLIHTR